MNTRISASSSLHLSPRLMLLKPVEFWFIARRLFVLRASLHLSLQFGDIRGVLVIQEHLGLVDKVGERDRELQMLVWRRATNQKSTD